VKRLQVLSVASEAYPLVKTGGLADVSGALPKALAAEGISMATLLPGYPPVLKALTERSLEHSLPEFFGAEARIVAGRAAGLDVFALDAPHLFARDGSLYADAHGQDWPDNVLRFAALGRAASVIGLGALEGYRPDVVHAHDWQAGLAPAYLHYAAQPRPATVMTVHNLAFAGKFPRALLARLGLPAEAYSLEGVEFYDSISYLKAGLQFADRITTVSPTYAQEILEPEAGMGFAGLLQQRAAVLSGILNGIDDEVWNPASDGQIAAGFDAANVRARGENTSALRKLFDLDDDENAPLLGVISRLSWQKGLDLLLGVLSRVVAGGAQVVVLGAGEADLEAGFAGAVRAFPGRVGCTIGYDEALAHLIQAGASMLLVPSRFEPCGLTQLCALRYGAVPVVARVGGLADTVIDANEMALAAGVATGIQFAPPARERLASALARASALYRDRETWAAIVAAGMRTDVSWRRPARRYASLYRELIAA